MSARYGTYAMEVLINHLLKLGARRNRLEAKVFGGGAVLASLASSNVGARNAEFVLDFLKTEKFRSSPRTCWIHIHAKFTIFPIRDVSWSRSCIEYITRPYSAGKTTTRFASQDQLSKVTLSCLFNATVNGKNRHFFNWFSINAHKNKSVGC